jgi:hypothetical protein
MICFPCPIHYYSGMANPYLTRPKAEPHIAELEATLAQLRNRRREPQVVAMAGFVLNPVKAAAKAPAPVKPAAPKPIAAAAKAPAKALFGWYRVAASFASK